MRSDRSPHARPGRRAAVGLILLWALATGVAPAASAEQAEVSLLDLRLAEIETLLAEAYFRTALGLADDTREFFARAGDEGSGPKRARLEVLAATGELALGQRVRARARLVRALRADPDLQLHESETSPRLVELLGEARTRLEVAESGP